MVDNPKHLLHAGQFARVQVAAQQDPNAIVVPQRAVQDYRARTTSGSSTASGRAQQRDVRLGLRVGSEMQVQEGLKAGDVVVVDGVQHINPTVLVKATPMGPGAQNGA